MKFHHPLLLAALALGFTHTAVRAASIGVHFTDGTYNLLATDTAGAPGFEQSNFNNAGTSGSSLLDNTGVGTTAAFSLTSNFGIFSSSIAPAGPDETLNASYVAASFSSGVTLSLSGIPYSSYSLVIYELPGSGAVQSTTLGGTTFYAAPPPDPNTTGYQDGDAATPYTYLLATSTSSGAPTDGADYVVFTGLSGSTQSVTIQSMTFQAATEFNGFQIVQTVPEPSTWAMLGLGISALLGFHRFSRRSRRVV